MEMSLGVITGANWFQQVHEMPNKEELEALRAGGSCELWGEGV